jgi:uncharacterized protein YcbK (DUF882 family)
MSYGGWFNVGASFFAIASMSALPHVAHGETVTHVVGRGHTLEAIANRYHVSVKTIAQANRIKDPKHLRVGDSLTIPGATVSTLSRAGAAGSTKGKTTPQHPVTYAMRARTPGVVHAARIATTEEVSFRVNDRRGHVSPNAMKQAERLLRFSTGQTHPIDPRLLALLAVVSDHFGSRKIEVISGFRPYTPTQYTPHSNHNVGKAIDFRVVGVPNEVLRDYCRTLRNVGVGYYPNSTFVHLDVRPTSAFWIDYSKPGEPPRYNAANVDADEGTSDVADDAHGPPPQSDAKPADGGLSPADGRGAPAPATPTPGANATPAPSPTTAAATTATTTPGATPSSAPAPAASPTAE